LQTDKKAVAAVQAKYYAEAVTTAPLEKSGGGGGRRAKPKPLPATNATEKGGDKKRGGKANKKASSTGGDPKVVKPSQKADESVWTAVGRNGVLTIVDGGKTKAADKAAGKTAKAETKAADKTPEKVPPPKKGGNERRRKGKGGKTPQKGDQPLPKSRKIRPPKQAAVLLSADPARKGEKPVSLGEAISGVRSSIKLADLGIASLRPKKAAGGGILFEIPGQESGPRADKLAEALRALLEPKGVKVTRPVKLAEICVTGLDDSITLDEVREVIARVGVSRGGGKGW